MTSERLTEIENTAGQIDEAVRDLQMIVTHHPDVSAQGKREAICARLRNISNLAGSLRRRDERLDAGELNPQTALAIHCVNGMNCLAVMLKRNVLRTALTDLTDDNELLKIRNMAEIVTVRIDKLLAARQGFTKPAPCLEEVSHG